MRLSVKPRYALACLMVLAQNYSDEKYIALFQLSERLSLSKIYLEQVFSLLKNAKLVISTKGIQGGYRLAKAPSTITLFDIFIATENALFEKTEQTVAGAENVLEDLFQEIIFTPMDQALAQTLKRHTLADILTQWRERSTEAYMYYL